MIKDRMELEEAIKSVNRDNKLSEREINEILESSYIDKTGLRSFFVGPLFANLTLSDVDALFKILGIHLTLGDPKGRGQYPDRYINQSTNCCTPGTNFLCNDLCPPY